MVNFLVFGDRQDGLWDCQFGLRQGSECTGNLTVQSWCDVELMQVAKKSDAAVRTATLAQALILSRGAL